MNQGVINWGIIGPGNIAETFTRDLALLGENKVIAILGRTEEGNREFSQEFNVAHSYTELEEFVRHPGMDAVYIATPHPQHLQQALVCLEHKLPILCEKPMVINASQCRELMTASRHYHCFLMEGMWIRFLPSITTLLGLIKEDRIGNILSISASIGFKAPEDSNSRFFDPSLGGGSLLDLGIYPIFLSYLLLGKPSTIEAEAQLSNENVDEECLMRFSYAGGQLAELKSSLLEDIREDAIITGEKGMIRVQSPWYEKSPGLELILNNGETIVYDTPWEGHGLQFETAHVLECLQHGKVESDLMPLSLSLDLIEIMDFVREKVNVTYPQYE